MTVNIEQLQSEIKTELANIQNSIDERVKAIETKGADVEELKLEQKKMAEELDVKISALEKVTSQMAVAKKYQQKIPLMLKHLTKHYHL